MKDLKFKNKDNFTTPNNYFDHLENSILNETKRFGDVSSFDVPEDYFTSLESKILVSNAIQSKVKLRKLWISISSVAACLLAVAIIYFSFDNESNESNYSISKDIYSNEVNPEVEDAVYESLYKTYFVEDDTKKSPNDISLDDLDEFYSDRQLSSSR